MQYLNDCRQFYRQFREQYTTTGSILPSSRALARALARPLRAKPSPRRVLEIGPGTGAVTAEIVRCLQPGDRFDIVEINAEFVAHLRRRFAEEPAFQRVQGQTTILHMPLQDVPGERCYDVMVSGLPLNNFPMTLVEDIFRSYERLLKPDGTLSYFEYLWIRGLKMPFVPAPERERLQTLTDYLQEKISRHQIGEDIVPMNMPPAVARHFRFAKP